MKNGTMTKKQLTSVVRVPYQGEHKWIVDVPGRMSGANGEGYQSEKGHWDTETLYAEVPAYVDPCGLAIVPRFSYNPPELDWKRYGVVHVGSGLSVESGFRIGEGKINQCAKFLERVRGLVDWHRPGEELRDGDCGRTLQVGLKQAAQELFPKENPTEPPKPAWWTREGRYS